MEPLPVRIRQCQSVPEALLLLANEIENLKQRPDAGLLSWNEVVDDRIAWPEPPKGADLGPRMGSDHDATAQQRKIAALRAKIAEETDPDAVRALEAALRLALEEHVRLDSPDVVPSLGDEVVGEGWASLAKDATPEQIAERMQWAKQVGLEQYMRTAEALKMAAEHGGNDVEELYAWFSKVGPRGLFTADHTACLQLPYEARLWLVERMAEEDEVLGRDMGADLLKSTESMDRETAKEMYEPTWKA